MALDFAFTCPLPNGVHARPASAIEELARRFSSAVTLTNERTGNSADASSVLGIIGLAIGHGDPCRLVVSGSDERAAFASLTEFLRDRLPHSDDGLPSGPAAVSEIQLPRLLADAGAAIHRGTPVVAGIGAGRAVVVGAFTLPPDIPTSGAADPDAEVRRLEAALDAIADLGQSSVASPATGVPAAVLRAQQAMARDPEFRRRLRQAVWADGRTAAGALADAEAHFAATLAASGSALVRERALDVRDVCLRALDRMYGVDVSAVPAPPDVDWVLVTGRLTPGEFLAIDRRRLRGLVLAHGGATSHTVILARSFGVPTLVDVAGGVPASLHGRDVVVDADLGVLLSHVTDAARRYYALEKARDAGRRAWLWRFASSPAATVDGRRLEVGANVGSAAEAVRAFEEGAEGIGVFRTETLFQGRADPPSEDEQFDEYRKALEAAGDRPVIIRTLDVGGDKPMPYLRLPAEENPFLGYRAVRIYPEFEALVRRQVRALVRASAFGRLKLMVPMVTSVDEVSWVRRIVAEEQAAAAASRQTHDAGMPVGAMIEVPAAAFVMAQLCARVDFFSIGTNDLLQYTMAADRANPRVAALYDPMHPGFVRLLQLVVEAARAGGRWIGLCGEMGGQAEYLPLMVGLGLDEISVAVPRVGATKAALAQLSAAACDGIVGPAARCATAAEAAALLATGSWAGSARLFDADLIALDVEAESKAEAIKIAVDRLSMTGRTDRPRDVEAAVWAREVTYSTGFGHGCAVPHAKTDAVRSASLVCLRLRTPVDWESLDGAPVDVLFLLTMRASDTPTDHLQVLAALSRKLMHEDFRERLRRTDSAEDLCVWLRESLSVGSSAPQV